MKSTKGKSTGLHKQYFNGSPAHVGSKPAAPKTPAPAPAPKGY